jgi:UDP-N-acetylglucosamine--N-acetylmuramyl-(pentapeptide) pyrophosphoryl-undecaprenol N-acetylglucosamine transferase
MQQEKTIIALTGGGTGWHIVPLVALYNYLKESGNYQFYWVGEYDSSEEEVARKNNIKFLDISAGKIRRYFDWRNFYEPLKNLSGIIQWIIYIRKYKIDIVFSKWGFVSLPLCIAARILRKKVYIHESDIVTGLSNKLVSRFASKVFYTFSNEKIDEKKHIHSGALLNPELIDYLDDVEVVENERFTLMVIAWSQWSTRIFKTLLEILPDLQDMDFHIILGEKNMHFREDFKRFSNTIVHDFITQKRLGKILKNIDVAITRGSSSLWELYHFGIHSLIIPLKATGWDHQTKNAEYFKQKFGSDVLDEDDGELNLKLFRLLQKYKTFRKSELNLDGFFHGLQSIENHFDI